jgi:uronate dehydrogenase
MGQKRVLLTGASGLIGGACRKYWDDRYDLRLHIHRPEKVPEDAEDVVVGGCEDFELMNTATEGMEAVVHMAAIPSEDTFDNLLKSNVVATYNVLEASRLNGVKRVVFASTNHTTGAWEWNGIQANPDMPPRADSLYGASKVYGEVLGRFYADKYGLEFVSLRIGGVNRNDRPGGIRDIWMWTSHRDMAEICRLAVDVEGIQFAIVYGGSDNPNSCLEFSSAREVLGFVPQDHVSEYFSDLPPEVVAKHAATVWQTVNKGTGQTLKRSNRT